jgi:hypothetical protein
MGAWLLQQRFDAHDLTSMTRRGWCAKRIAIPRADGISHPEYDTVNIFYIIGVVVVVILIAGLFGLRV